MAPEGHHAHSPLNAMQCMNELYALFRWKPQAKAQHANSARLCCTQSMPSTQALKACLCCTQNMPMLHSKHAQHSSTQSMPIHRKHATVYAYTASKRLAMAAPLRRTMHIEIDTPTHTAER
eukprot:scaffold5005_cov21-Tisochrysis_lutea.AAC.2